MRAVSIAMGLLLGLMVLGNFRPEPKRQPRKARETHRIAIERPR